MSGDERRKTKDDGNSLHTEYAASSDGLSSFVLRLSSPFDGMAADYDDSFTASRIGRAMRRAVWRHMERCFHPGQQVLELGCGTGEDAVFLAQRGVRVLATDASAAMVATARAKVASCGLEHLVEVRQLAIADCGALSPQRNEQLHAPSPKPQAPSPKPFDGVLSNFGALNCGDDLGAVARNLAGLVRAGGRALLCVMGPLVPWEWGWYLTHGEPRKAFRRLRRGGTPWRGLTIRYPSVGALRQAFAPLFAFRNVVAVGALVPPSYAEGWAARHPHLFYALDRWERLLEGVPPLPALADHYLVELERVG